MTGDAGNMSACYACICHMQFQQPSALSLGTACKLLCIWLLKAGLTFAVAHRVQNAGQDASSFCWAECFFPVFQKQLQHDNSQLASLAHEQLASVGFRTVDA